MDRCWIRTAYARSRFTSSDLSYPGDGSYTETTARETQCAFCCAISRWHSCLTRVWDILWRHIDNADPADAQHSCHQGTIRRNRRATSSLRFEEGFTRTENSVCPGNEEVSLTELVEFLSSSRPVRHRPASLSGQHWRWNATRRCWAHSTCAQCEQARY